MEVEVAIEGAVAVKREVEEAVQVAVAVEEALEVAVEIGIIEEAVEEPLSIKYMQVNSI